MTKILKMLTKGYLSRTILLYFLLLYPSLQSKCQTNIKRFEYFDKDNNFSVQMDLSKLDNSNLSEKIKMDLKNEFNSEIKSYKGYFEKSNRANPKITVSLHYEIDSVYMYSNLIMIFYNVYQENIPLFSKIHWVKSFTYNKNNGKREELNICDFIDCKKNFQIPLYRIVNSKLTNPDCFLNVSKKLILKYFVPLPEDKFIVYVWKDLAKNSTKCDLSETYRLTFTKEELIQIINTVP